MKKFSERVIIKNDIYLDEKLFSIIFYLDSKLYFKDKDNIRDGDNWFIFVKPKIGIFEPTIFLFNPARGCYILDSFSYQVDSVKKDNRRGGAYREKIVEYFIPEINYLLKKDYSLLDSIFGFETIFIDSLENNGAELIVDKIKNFSISSNWKKDFNKSVWTVLHPGVHNVLAGQNVEYFKPSTRQKNIINLDFGKHHRVRGVAGGGKSFILAYRAAKLASEGKRVLVTCYNLSLCSFLREVINRVPVKFNWSNITIMHKDGLFRSLCIMHGVSWPTGSGNNIWKKDVPERIKYIMDNYKIGKFDAVLIDEGQDFDFTDYSLISRFLDNSDELMVVCDKKQNLYENDLSWIDKRKEKGLFKFNSGWEEINTSVRLPRNIARFANVFSNEFELDDTVSIENITQDPSLIGQENFKWLNIKEKNLNSYILNILKYVKNDIVIIVPENLIDNLGDFLKNNNIYAELFSGKHKRIFSKNDNVKISTIQQFKGREANNVIFFIPESNRQNNPSLIYTAITRSRKNLFVLNSNTNFYRWSNCSDISDFFNKRGLFGLDYINKGNDIKYENFLDKNIDNDVEREAVEDIVYDYNAVIVENEEIIEKKSEAFEKIKNKIAEKKEVGEVLDNKNKDVSNNFSEIERSLKKKELDIISREKDLCIRELEIKKKEDELKQAENEVQARETKINEDGWEKNKVKTGRVLDSELSINTISNVYVFGTSKLDKIDIPKRIIKFMRKNGYNNFSEKDICVLTDDYDKLQNSNICKLIENWSIDAVIIANHPHSINGTDNLEEFINNFNASNAGVHKVEIANCWKENKKLSSVTKSSLDRALKELINKIKN